VLRVSNINAFYGSIQVLWDVSFDIKEKEIVALVGANGAGKSTILDVISGLLNPASGAVEFLGERIDQLTPQEIIEKGISYIPEGRRLFPDMTVYGNLELGAYIPRAWKKRHEVLKRVYRIFPRLEERKRQLAKTLSGGEQQMLSIGRGMMSTPKLCMFDEASYGLSPLLTLNIVEAIKTLRDQGTTILLIEQNLKLALEASDRAYVLENGRIALEGPSKDILEDEYVKTAYLGL